MENGGVWSGYHSRPFVNFRSTSLCQPQGEGHTPKGEKIVDIILYYIIIILTSYHSSTLPGEDTRLIITEKPLQYFAWREANIFIIMS